MDIPFLLHRPSEAVSTIYFANVIAWLKGVADAQKSGQLLDPSAPSYDDDEYPLPEFSFPVFDEQPPPPPPQPSYPCFTAQNWPRLSSPASITNVPSHPQSFCHDLRRSIGAAQDMWGFTPPPNAQPYVVGSPFGYVPLPVHVPHHTLPHDPSPFYAIPPFLQDLHATSDKLQHALRQHQITSARQQWAAANPSLCSAHERSRRTHAAHITERRRRPFQATPYYKITSPYLAS